VPTSRNIGTSGIATGGGNLTADRTINVPGTNLGSSGTGATRTITSSTGNNTSITYSAADLNAVPTSRTLTAGTGLTGGGNLTANRTFNIDIASQAEAEAGTNNTKVMTPLRAKQTSETFSKAVGEVFAIWDHLSGANAPSNAGAAKFIRLTAGQSGAGGYNEGLLTSESVSGSAPLVTATAQIATGPLQGQTIPLLNTEGSFVRPGTSSGTLQFDQMQRITGRGGRFSGFATFNMADASGAFTANQTANANVVAGQLSQQTYFQDFDSANSPNARVSSSTSGETRPKNRQATYYMRVV
jgi:hypothetical protein